MGQIIKNYRIKFNVFVFLIIEYTFINNAIRKK